MTMPAIAPPLRPPFPWEMLELTAVELVSRVEFGTIEPVLPDKGDEKFVVGVGLTMTQLLSLVMKDEDIVV